MIWFYLFILFSLGTLVGFSLRKCSEYMYCPNHTYHDFEYIGKTTKIAKEWDEGDSYNIPGEYTYEVKVKKFRCKKCGYVRYEQE